MKIFSYDLYQKKHWPYIGMFYNDDRSKAKRFDGYSKEDIINQGYYSFTEEYKDCFIEIKNEYRKEIDIMVAKTDEVKELKRDIEILLNAYMFDKPLDKKSRNRIAERHFDIIEKQSAKQKLKKLSKNGNNNRK